MRLGYRPAPLSGDKHRKRPFEEVKSEYIAWGESQGGRMRKPWAAWHAQKRHTHLLWWAERLGLDVLADLEGILPRVEQELRCLQ